jgi:hypothetical protein
MFYMVTYGLCVICMLHIDLYMATTYLCMIHMATLLAWLHIGDINHINNGKGESTDPGQHIGAK